MVLELTNKSASPHDSFEVSVEEAQEVLERWFLDVPLPEEGGPADGETCVVLWHTHPRGNVGPSRLDLEHRVPGGQYLVVALPDGPACRY